MTRDGGQTWTTISALPEATSSIACTDHQMGMYALKWNDAIVYRSLDGGNSWRTSMIGFSAMTLTRASDGMLYVVSNIDYPGIVYSSADSGATWRERAGLVGQDCWSIVADNCDPARLYLTTEDFDNHPWASSLWVSSDRGTTWSISYSDPRAVAGSIASFADAAISGTITQGILRSTDDGMSWESSGGANQAEDNRSICMVNENIGFALDLDGNIWGTFNGGGNPINLTSSGSLTTASPTLFEADTQFCDSLSRSVFFKRSGCAPPSISQWSIIGTDSASYQMGALSYDSIPIILRGIQRGARHAQLVLVLNDSSSDTVELAGFVDRIPNTLSVSPAALFELDTISCDSLTRGVSFRRGGCSPPAVVRWSIIGADANSFDASNLSYDSIMVTIHGKHPGNQAAQLILALDNGSSDTVALKGFVNAAPNVLTASPATLFQTDTISCDSLTRSIYFSRSGCSPPSISSFSIIGRDSANFEAGNLTDDSIRVMLRGVKQGNQDAKFVLALDNGSSDTVTLAGYVNLIPHVVTLSTSDVKTNTLGATVSVPITVDGLLHLEDVELMLHYDGTVDYLGSFSPSGAKLDASGVQWPGHSELQIAGAVPGEVAGYAKFNVFNDSSTRADVRFDSLQVLTAISPCEYSDSSATATSVITAPSGCTIPILSRFVHLGRMPVFSVRPNPTSGNVWISSNVEMSGATIEVFDMLGMKQGEITVAKMNDQPLEVRLPAASGVYTIRIQSALGTRTLRVIQAR